MYRSLLTVSEVLHLSSAALFTADPRLISASCPSESGGSTLWPDSDLQWDLHNCTGAPWHEPSRVIGLRWDVVFLDHQILEQLGISLLRKKKKKKAKQWNRGGTRFELWACWLVRTLRGWGGGCKAILKQFSSSSLHNGGMVGDLYVNMFQKVLSVPPTPTLLSLHIVYQPERMLTARH